MQNRLVLKYEVLTKVIVIKMLNNPKVEQGLVYLKGSTYTGYQ